MSSNEAHECFSAQAASLILHSRPDSTHANSPRAFREYTTTRAPEIGRCYRSSVPAPAPGCNAFFENRWSPLRCDTPANFCYPSGVAIVVPRESDGLTPTSPCACQCGGFARRSSDERAVSSAVERLVYTELVGGSIPSLPTPLIYRASTPDFRKRRIRGRCGCAPLARPRGPRRSRR